jgi:hypothetical protein
MAKEVLYHWVEMRKVIVPDECPTDTFADLDLWMSEHGDSKKFTVKIDSRDYEIVDVDYVDDSELAEVTDVPDQSNH